MREIKFRAWDKKGNQMINYISSINFKNQNFIDIVSEYDLDVHNGENLGHYGRHTSEIEIMQFTGLKDKTGRDIYEGDIVNFGEGVNLPIEWAWNSYNFHNNSDWDITNHDPEKEFQIIGNIYENPELIKSNE